MKPLVLLQNAWSGAYAGETWPRRSWLMALEACRSGQRLRVAFPDPESVHYDNTTPIVGATPDSVVPPDLEHVQALLDQGPPIVVACGKQAGEVALKLWDGPLILCPHPAYRFVTDELFRMVGAQVRRRSVPPLHLCRIRYVQGRDVVRIELLDQKKEAV